MKSWQVMVGFILFVIIGMFAALFSEYATSLLPMILLAFPAYFSVLRKDWKKGLLVLFILSVYATVIEATSILTGFPYGFFEYGTTLGFKLFGVVPWAVSFGWVPLVVGAVIVAQQFVKKDLHVILLSTLLLVISDLVLDPGAVVLNFWQWTNPGVYYTIPFSNYLGWIFSSLIGTTMFVKLFRKPLSLIGTLTLSLGNAFWIGVAVISNLWIPLIIGVLFQGLLIYVWFTKHHTKSPKSLGSR